MSDKIGFKWKFTGSGSCPIEALKFFQASFFAISLIAISLRGSFLYFGQK